MKKSTISKIVLCSMVLTSCIWQATSTYADNEVGGAIRATESSPEKEQHTIILKRKYKSKPDGGSFENKEVKLEIKKGEALGDALPHEAYLTAWPDEQRFLYKVCERSYIIDGKEMTYEQAREYVPTHDMTIEGDKYDRHATLHFQFYDGRDEKYWTKWEPAIQKLNIPGTTPKKTVDIVWKKKTDTVWEHPEGKIHYMEYVADITVPHTNENDKVLLYDAIDPPVFPATNPGKNNNKDMMFMNNTKYDWGHLTIDANNGDKGYLPIVGITATPSFYYAYAPGSTEDKPFPFTVKETYRGIRHTFPDDQNPDRSIKVDMAVDHVYKTTYPNGRVSYISKEAGDFPYIVNGGDIPTVVFKEKLNKQVDTPLFPTTVDGVEGVNFLKFEPQNVDGYTWTYMNPEYHNGASLYRSWYLAYLKNVNVTFDAKEGTISGLNGDQTNSLTMTGLLSEKLDVPAKLKNTVNPVKLPKEVKAPFKKRFASWTYKGNDIKDPLSLVVEKDEPIVFEARYEDLTDTEAYEVEKQDVDIEVGDPIPSPDKFIKNKDKLPDKTTYKYKNPPKDLSKEGDVNVTIIITYPDNSTKEINAILHIKKKKSNFIPSNDSPSYSDTNKEISIDEKGSIQDNDNKENNENKRDKEKLLPRTGVNSLSLSYIALMISGCLVWFIRRTDK